MDVKYINPFLDAVKIVLEQFGASDIRRGEIRKKRNMHVEMDITAVIGLVGGVRGNISFSLSQKTAKSIVSAMMMGMPVTEMDALARSAIGELANMITGTASTLLAETKVLFDITPPTIVFGNDIYFVISSVETLAVDIGTPYGEIEVNIGLEM